MLKDILLDSKRRSRVIDDCVQLVEDEVDSKSGLTGMAIKAGYTVVKKVKPGFVREAVDHLIDDFVARLSPFHESWLQAGGSFEAFLAPRKTEVANALLGVTDDKAARIKNTTIKKAYEKLRPTAEKNVEAAVPGIARVIARHAGPDSVRSVG